MQISKIELASLMAMWAIIGGLAVFVAPAWMKAHDLVTSTPDSICPDSSKLQVITVDVGQRIGEYVLELGVNCVRIHVKE